MNDVLYDLVDEIYLAAAKQGFIQILRKSFLGSIYIQPYYFVDEFAYYLLTILYLIFLAGIIDTYRALIEYCFYA